jgi:hypothetical protein
MDRAPALRGYPVDKSLGSRVRVLHKLTWGAVGGLRDPLMRHIGLMVTRGCPARADMCELRAIFDFVVTNVRYTGDITDKDTFQSALRTLQFGGGDCDDHSILNATLAMENGFRCKWRITSNTGATWDHIYCMAAVPKHKPSQWIPLDTTLGYGRFNSEPRRAKYEDFEVQEG